MSDEKVVLAVVGSRNCNDKKRVFDEIEKWIAENGRPVHTIVSGGAAGVDSLAAAYAKEHNLELVVYAANWREHGKSAGPLRNAQIVARCSHVLALPSSESKGTLDTIQKAQRAGKLCKIVLV